MILVELGKIHYKIFKQTIRAKELLKEAIELGDLVEANPYTRDWYKDAVAMTEEIRAKVEANSQKRDLKKEKAVQELGVELALLKKHDDDKLGDYVEFIFKDFPPKHVEDAKKPEVPDNLSKCKKVLIKVIHSYHPDRVDRDKFGDKHFVICEEISKALNERYNSIKFSE